MTCELVTSPEVVATSVAEGEETSLSVRLTSADGDPEQRFVILSRVDWIEYDLGNNQSQTGLQQVLQLTLSAADLEIGRYSTTLRVSWPRKGGGSCSKNVPVTLNVTVKPGAVTAPARDPRAGAVLAFMADLIKSGWTQGAPARDAQGNRLEDPSNTSAVSWCLTGALTKACSHATENGKTLIDGGQYLVPALQLAAGGVSDLSVWNDHPLTTQTKVVSVVEAAKNQVVVLAGRQNQIDQARP